MNPARQIRSMSARIRALFSAPSKFSRLSNSLWLITFIGMPCEAAISNPDASGTLEMTVAISTDS